MTLARRLVAATVVLFVVTVVIAIVTTQFIPISDGHDHRLPYETWMWSLFGLVGVAQLVVAIMAIVACSRERARTGTAPSITFPVFAIVIGVIDGVWAFLVNTIGNMG